MKSRKIDLYELLNAQTILNNINFCQQRSRGRFEHVIGCIVLFFFWYLEILLKREEATDRDLLIMTVNQTEENRDSIWTGMRIEESIENRT